MGENRLRPITPSAIIAESSLGLRAARKNGYTTPTEIESVRERRIRENRSRERRGHLSWKAHRNGLRVVEMLREDHEDLGHELGHVVREGRDVGAETQHADVALEDDL